MKCVIFDFDGVILDTEAVRFNDLQILLKENGCTIDKSQFKDLVGVKTRHFLKDNFPQLSKEKLDHIIKKKFELQESNIERYPILDGIKELLEFLKSKGCIIAITTGSYKGFVNKILENNGLRDYFSFITSGEEFSSTKPDPECYNISLEKIGINPEEACVIEDAIGGIAAAKSAGCKVIGIKTYLDDEHLSQADVVLNDHFEILDYFKKNGDSSNKLK